MTQAAQKADWRHLHPFRIKDRRFVFDGRNCAPFELDELGGAALDLRRALDREAAIAQLAEQHGTAAARQVVGEVEQLVAASQAAGPGLRGPSKQAHFRYTILLSLTHRCNLACTYCYASRYRARRDRPPDMPRDVISRAIDWAVDELAPKADFLHFSFGGTGEPLLVADAHDHVRKCANRAAEQTGKTITCSLATTNLTLATDPELFERVVASAAPGLVISLDGPPEIHDAARCFPDGSGTYSDIVSVLGRLRERGIRPTAEATLSARHPRVTEVFRHLWALGFRQIDIRPVKGAADAPDSITPQNVGTLQREYARFVEYLLEQDGPTLLAYLLAFWYRGDYFGRFVSRVLRRSRTGYRCGGGRQFFCVDTDGGIYQCAFFAANTLAEGRLGSVSHGLDPAMIEAVRQDLFVDNRQPCRSCWARYLCGGGCPYLGLLARGRIDRPDPAECALVKHLIELAIYFVSVVRETHPEVLAALPAHPKVAPQGQPLGRCLRRDAAHTGDDTAPGTRANLLTVDHPGQMKRRIWRGPRHLAATAALAWDDRALYLEAHVQHQRATAWSRDDQGPRGDGISAWFVPSLPEPYFAWTEREVRARGEFYELDAGVGSAHVTLRHWAGGSCSPARVVSRAVVKRAGDRTVYRLAIPWDELRPFSPTPGALFGWNLWIHHDDGGAQCAMEWLPDRTFGVIRVESSGETQVSP